MDRKTLHEMGFGSESALLKLSSIRRFFAPPHTLQQIPSVSTSSVIQSLISYSHLQQGGRVMTSAVSLSQILSFFLSLSLSLYVFFFFLFFLRD